MSDKCDYVIVCRSAPPKEAILPGAHLGHDCSICLEPLQLTDGALKQLEARPDARLLCNPCGLLFVHLAEDSGHEMELRQSPAARTQLDHGNDSPLADWVRRRAR